MTTQPRPAGWYPDPTGMGGQKYWDGGDWEHLDPAPNPAAVDHSGDAGEGGGDCEVPTPKK